MSISRRSRIERWPPLPYADCKGFGGSPVRPAGASWNDTLGEFVLPYEAVRTSPSPDAALLEFRQSTYAAAADAGGWDRAALERVFDRRPA